MILDRVRSSCGSTPLPIEYASVSFPVDMTKEPTPCKLYVENKFFKTKVGIGQGHPTAEGVMLHCCPLLARFTQVTIDALVKGRYHGVELDFPKEKDRKTLG
jgi:hypothetical protein